MLRTKSDPARSGIPQPSLVEALPTDFPGLDPPYVTGERPPGILFYQGKTSFWLPYFLLQGIRYEAEKLTLQYSGKDVIVDGRGLHALYVELARQVVFRIVEQGDRYSSISEATIHVTRISEIPKES